jgi:uncharacterized protein DUF2510
VPVPAGWYADPQAPQANLRYFDGQQWTAAVALRQGTPVRLGAEPNDAVHWLLPTGRTWQSIAAGYVALFALVLWFLGPVALGLGLWALSASSRTGAHGRGRAIFAIVVGAFASVAMVAFLASTRG